MSPGARKETAFPLLFAIGIFVLVFVVTDVLEQRRKVGYLQHRLSSLERDLFDAERDKDVRQEREYRERTLAALEAIAGPVRS
jgi:hypothetical protein